MCKASEKYEIYDSCELKLDKGQGLIQNLADRLRLHEDRQHRITTRLIFLCGDARARPDRSHCATVEEILPGSVLKKPAYSAFAGPCPACSAAAAACNKILIVDSPDALPPSRGPEDSATGPAQSPSRGDKKKSREQNTSNRRKHK